MNITLNFPEKRFVGWRGLHEVEGGRVPDPTNTVESPPAVIPPYNPTVALEMTESIQWLSYDLMHLFCSAASGERWRTLHRVGIAMNNGAANGFDGGTPHRDYINKIDLDATKLNGEPDLPRYDKMQRTFQGSFITGTLDRKVIWCVPGVDAIDARDFHYPTRANLSDPPTPAQWEILNIVIAKDWISTAVCAANPPFHLRGKWGAGCLIVYPFILDRPVSFEARFFTPWNETYLPNPTKVYL